MYFNKNSFFIIGLIIKKISRSYEFDNTRGEKRTLLRGDETLKDSFLLDCSNNTSYEHFNFLSRFEFPGLILLPLHYLDPGGEASLTLAPLHYSYVICKVQVHNKILRLRFVRA